MTGKPAPAPAPTGTVFDAAADAAAAPGVGSARGAEHTTLVFDRIDDAIARFDRDWRYVWVNERMQALAGASAESRLGKVFWDVYPELVGTELERRYRQAMQAQQPDQMEIYFAPWDRWLESRLYPSAGGLTVMLSDASERVRNERALAETQHLMKLLVDSVTEHEIYLLDAQGCVRSWTPAAERVTGYRAQDIVGQPLSLLYIEEDRTAGEPERALRAAAEQGTYRTDGWRRRRDGSRYWASVVIDAVRDASGALMGYAKVTRDLSERRRIDSVRAYAQRQQQVLDEERRRIARALHDDLGHRLAVMAMDVAEAMRAPLPPATRELLGAVRAMVTETADAMRRILADLRPPELDELGLSAAIESFVARWAARYGIEASAVVQGDVEALPQPVQSALYSLVQEALANVAKHARAHSVGVVLAREGEWLRLEMRDDGVGMSDAERHREGRYGLLGMDERVRLLEGELDIDSAPGRGTVLRVRMPAEPAAARDGPAGDAD